jgi:hypothetical protein
MIDDFIYGLSLGLSSDQLLGRPAKISRGVFLKRPAFLGLGFCIYMLESRARERSLLDNDSLRHSRRLASPRYLRWGSGWTIGTLSLDNPSRLTHLQVFFTQAFLASCCRRPLLYTNPLFVSRLHSPNIYHSPNIHKHGNDSFVVTIYTTRLTTALSTGYAITRTDLSNFGNMSPLVSCTCVDHGGNPLHCVLVVCPDATDMEKPPA